MINIYRVFGQRKVYANFSTVEREWVWCRALAAGEA